MARDDKVCEKIALLGIQRRNIDDPFYSEGNKLCQSAIGKKAIIIFDKEEYLHQSLQKFNCHVPGCIKSFETLLEFESHYNTNHRYVCSTCNKRLVSPHLLDLHVSESHDSYFAAMAERKPMYQCYVETCPLRYSNSKERRSHCIEDHKYPADFRYDVENKNVESKRTAGKPRSASFGHGVTRGFFKNRGRGAAWHQQGRGKKKENGNEVTMAELEEALPVIDD